MKNVHRVITGAMFAMIVLLVPSMAQSESTQKQNVERCQYYLDNYPGYFKNQGDCIQRLKGGSASYCKYLKERGYFKQPGARFKSQGDCANYYR